MEKIVIASGFFDPIHSGHIEYLKLAKQLGDKLIVIVDNAEQTIKKKGYEFMPFEERMKIVEALGFVDEVYPSIDKEIPVTETIRKLAQEKGAHIFAKGGDRYSYEIPEAAVCKEFGIEIIDGLGAKIQSSSELVRKQKENEKQKKI